MDDKLKVRCYIHNGTPRYKIHKQIERCKDPKSLLSDDSKDEYSVVQDYIRDTALEEAKSQIGNTPLGVFSHPEEIGEKIFDLCDKLIKENILLQYVEVEEPRFWTVKSEKIELPEELYSFGRDGEGDAIETGDVILRMMREFLQRGIWHIGFKGSNGVITDIRQFPFMSKNETNWPCWKDIDGNACTPFLWFGLEDEEPIDIWSLCYDSEHDWKSFWFNDLWSLDWNALFGGYDNYYTVWMFCECGMDEPTEDFERVRSQCPVQLAVDESFEDLERKIQEYAMSLYANGVFSLSNNILSKDQFSIKAESLRKAIYHYGYDYGASAYEDYPDNVDEILDNDEYSLLDICDSGPEVIGSGMLSEIEGCEYFEKDLFSPVEYAIDFYDILDKYLCYEDMSETFDKGVTDAIKAKYGIVGFQKLYPGFK